MKRTVSLSLALFLSLSLLTGCQSSKNSTQADSSLSFVKTGAVTQIEWADLTADPDGSEPERAADAIPLSAGNDGVVSILVIGNSMSIGWQDELNAMLDRANANVVVYSAIVPGTELVNHWEWKENGEKVYSLRCNPASGSAVDEENLSLEECLDFCEWDAISIQDAFFRFTNKDYSNKMVRKMRLQLLQLAEDMYDYLRDECPQAVMLWHETWVPEVGWRQDQYSVMTKAEQKRLYEIVREIGNKVAADNNAYLIPTGDAFQFARAKGFGKLTRDGLHDGARQGGQFLNACVWYERITGNSCYENDWMPAKYPLSGRRALQMKYAAHETVEEYLEYLKQ